MNYKYDVEQECFVREDGLGKKFWINSSEAHRIMSMYSLGNSIGEIRNKIEFVNARKVTESTIVNFIKNVNNGNIELSKAYPAPIRMVESITDSDRISKLEERVTSLENIISEIKSDCFCTCFAGESKNVSNMDKVKSWLRL